MQPMREGVTHMVRIIRWAGWVSLAVASMALVFSLAIVAGRALAASGVARSVGCSMGAAPAAFGGAFSNAFGGAKTTCPMAGGTAQDGDQASAVAPAVPGTQPTPSDAEILADPNLPVPPGQTFSCH
jgi:hypothetical protein